MSAIALLCSLAYSALLIGHAWITWGKRANPYTLTISTVMMAGAVLAEAVWLAAKLNMPAGVDGWGIALWVFNTCASVFVGWSCHRRAEKMMNR